MTWYADEIILRATPRALLTVSASQTLRPFSYHVRSLDGHEWHRNELMHALPEEGLLVIRPVCGRSSHGYEWHDVPVLEWNSLDSTTATTTLLDPAVEDGLSDILDEESTPPKALRRALAALAVALDQPVIYYACFMWGSDVEYEYCLTYGPNEALLITESDVSPIQKGVEESLRRGLRVLGLHLPTSYFALHTRGFPWHAHKLS